MGLLFRGPILSRTPGQVALLSTLVGPAWSSIERADESNNEIGEIGEGKHKPIFQMMKTKHSFSVDSNAASRQCLKS